MINSGLNCECCGTEMKFGGISNDVYCPNNDCLLFDKCYSYDFIKNRAEAAKNNQKRSNKQPIKLVCR